MTLFTLKLPTALVSDCTLNEHLNSYNSLLWTYPIKRRKSIRTSEHQVHTVKRSIYVSSLLKKSMKRLCFYPVMKKIQIKNFVPEKAKLLQLCLEGCLLDALDCHCETSTYKWKGKQKTVYIHQSESAVLLSFMLIVTYRCYKDKNHFLLSLHQLRIRSFHISL